ncbi:DUF7115 domain-containing protein [Halarchaeum nitratireducens]|uniref:DUF7115 domain-containing protein n=1 Tax=Halarchaeum nitratireducens TaxID=489913 RepID=A0A830G915_9EURY|nr:MULTISPECIES: hypothetical protein [Halarchaeum]MBP2251381.1 hypothetical protein [Halarchaeum solikamskense]GGN07662.1 hypothetical protein GCM10009021_03590 [Halarchaeum nitratireducens]
MDVPAAVASALDEESVAARVPLRGDDALFVTPTRTLVYHADGLLSSESVEELGHDAERVAVDDGRRKTTLTLDYGLDGERSVVVPAGRVDDVLHPVLAGVLNAAGVTDPGESVSRTYHFNELTLAVTDRRLVRHVGAAVWDEDYDEIDYADVTGFDTEEGSVASQLVLETTGRTQRIKVPNEQFRDVRETVEEALYEFHGVPSRAAFHEAMREESADEASGAAGESDDADDADAAVAFADAGIDAIGERRGERRDAAAGGDRHAPERDASAAAVDADRIETTATDDANSAGDPDPADDTGPADDANPRVDATGATPRDDATASEAEAGDSIAAAGASVTSDGDETPERTAPFDSDALVAELEAARDAIADQRDRAEAQRDTLERQRRAIDAQLDALDEQRERLEDALDAIPDR